MTRAYTLGAKLLMLAGFLLGSSGAALTQDDVDTDMIVGGQPAEEGDFPYQVRIYSVGNDDIGFCGGSVIGDKWVLTAAHCVMDVDKVMVGYGSVDRTQTKRIPSEKILMHPDYLEGKATDVALIKLQDPIGGPDRIIRLADAQTENSSVTPGAKLVVSGWGARWEVQKDTDVMNLLKSLSSGKQLEELYYPRLLHWVQVQPIETEQCKSLYKQMNSPLKVEDTEICAMQPGARKDSCYGDSGGPLVVPAADGEQPVQVGVVSWGEWCAHETLPGVYARVSSFKGWIDDTIKNN